jgi:hypothetical protein
LRKGDRRLTKNVGRGGGNRLGSEKRGAYFSLEVNDISICHQKFTLSFPNSILYAMIALFR